MATMNVSVPDPMKGWVQTQIDEGKYASSSDYVRDLMLARRNAIPRRGFIHQLRC